jgi:phosphotransferase system enzyme I (PtsI)
VDLFLASGSDVLRNSAPDILDVRQRVLAHLCGTTTARSVPSGHVVLADDLAPSEFLSIDWAGGGLVLRHGSPSSHLAVLARARGVPMIVDIGPVDAPDATYALVDGDAGVAVLQLSRDASIDIERPVAGGVSPIPATDTADATRADVMVNISDLAELDRLDPDACDGIGLVRSEFLLSGPEDIISEERQLLAYRRLLEWAEGRPVRIRTVDAGDDKPVHGFADPEGRAKVGLRGLRLSLRRIEIFRVQLRALARAAAGAANLSVMFPMVTTQAEFREARALFDEEVEALRRRGIDAAVPPLGIMIEVPAAALAANLFDGVAYFSIGSNDLFQYTMAIPRDDASMASLAAVDHPAMSRLIEAVVEAGRELGVGVAVCGDVAADPRRTEWLLSCGVRSLSVPPSALAAVRASVRVSATASAWRNRG